MFLNRNQAGRRLAEYLGAYRKLPDCLVLALPRGGVVVGYEIAETLHLYLDVLIVRKIGLPGRPELTVGAVSETGAVFLNQEVIARHGTSEACINAEVERQKEEIVRRVGLYRGGKTISNLQGKVVLLADDGIAPGAAMKAAITVLRKENVRKLVVCLPVAPRERAAELNQIVDELVCLNKPGEFPADGDYYRDFSRTTDREVVELLHAAAQTAA